MNLPSALYKTVIDDNYKTYRANPGRTLLAAVAIAATGFYLPVLVMPMLYTALASFVARVFYNMGAGISEKQERAIRVDAQADIRADAERALEDARTEKQGLLTSLKEKNMQIQSLETDNALLQQAAVKTIAAVDAATQPLNEQIAKLYIQINQLNEEIGRLATNLAATAVTGDVDTEVATLTTQSAPQRLRMQKPSPSDNGMFSQFASPLTAVANNHAVDGTVNTSGRSTPI